MARRKRVKAEGLIDPKDKDVLERAMDRIAKAEDVWEEQREASRSDAAFMVPGGQWDPSIRADRSGEGRPCLEIDRLTPFVNLLVNEQRQNRPQPNVNPVGDGADKDTAEIFQGMIRHIAYMSDGDVAIDTAYEHMVVGGYGYWRVLTDYVTEDSWDQEIKIGRITDPNTVILDPSSEDPAGADAEWGAIATWLTVDQFKEQYPDSKLATSDMSVWRSLSDIAPEWATADGESVMVTEYFERQRQPMTVYLYEDGTTGTEERDGYKDKRTSYKHVVKWYKLSPVEVLDSQDWPGKYIPIVACYGKEMRVDGKRMLMGLVRTAKDPARFYNYWKSCQAETIALAPKAPYMVPKGAIVDEATWKKANRKPVAYLEYNSVVDGQPVNVPQPVNVEPPIGAISSAMMGAEEDLKAVTGMYDPVRGIQQGGQSGVAIRQLQRQGQSVNYHFQDNLARSVRHLGRILIDLIPKIYDTARVIRICKPDGTEELVQINQEYLDPNTGQLRIYRLDAGRYDVTVSVGPSYQTKRQESQAILDSLLQNPVLGALIAQKAPDLVASLLDFHMAKELQERLTPPEFAKGKGQQIPAAAQQQMQQMQQGLEQMGQAVQQYQAQLQQAAQQIQQLEAEGQSKQADMAMKQQEMQAKAQSEERKAQLDEAKLMIDAQKLELDKRKLDIEAAKIKLDAMRGITAGPMGGPGEPAGHVELGIEVPEDLEMPKAKRPVTVEELVGILGQQQEEFQDTLAKALSIIAQALDRPPAPMPPIEVTMVKNRDGSITARG